MKIFTWRLGLFLLVYLLCGAVNAQTKRLVFIGDAGRAPDVRSAIRSKVALDSNTTIVFLGDDVLADKQSDIEDLLSFITGTEAKAILIPGNKEWDNGGIAGYDYLRREEKLVEALGNKNISLQPSKGCPGPEEVKINNDVVLVVMNTQWWLHEYDKPGIESGCDQKTEMQVTDELADVISDNRKKLVIFAAHHPLYSTGLRSGYFGVKQHVFPLTDIPGMRNAYLPMPVVGSLYPIVRSVFVSRQDQMHNRYKKMATTIDNILKEHPYLIRVSGHEHGMGLYDNENNFYILSGAGSKGSRVQKTPGALYTAAQRGFTVIEISENKEVKTSFYEVRKDGVHEGFTRTLLNFSKLPPIAEDTAKLANVMADSAAAPVNIKYDDAGGLRRWLMGNNYRKEWSEPVRLKVFRIEREKGGFTFEGQGGGKQTTSVRIKDASGKVWSLRSINKDPEKVIPENFRNTFAQDAVQDILSASHPYAARPVTAMSRALNIAAPQIEYYFVPNDTALGYYRPAFANTVAMIEERDPSLYGEESASTWEALNRHVEGKQTAVDQKSFLKARLFDVMIADFDRHYEQYKWGERKDGEDKTYYAIPKDRDQAFFHSDGLVMSLFAYSRMPFLKGLRNDIPNLRWWGFVSRDIDGFYLNQLQRSEWQQVASDIKATLTDDVINTSLQQMPREIYEMDGAELSSKLRDRRDLLPDKAMEYYRFLAKNVNVVGTNDDEEFHVSNDKDGTRVEVVRKDSAATKHTIYSRVFDDAETREVRLYGLNGNDRFTIDGNVQSHIRFRIIGGKGDDRFDIQGRAPNTIYDDAGEKNEIVNRRRTISMISHRKDVNNYSFREDTYGTIKIPTINLGFNIEDQVLAGLGMEFIRRGFRKDPYASRHALSSLFSFVNNAYQVRYEGDVNDIFRHYDLVMNAAFVNPNLSNFFGFGNETVKDPGLSLHYYRVRYSTLTGDISFRKRFAGNKLYVMTGPAFYYYWNKPAKNDGRILENPSTVGLDSADVYTRKFYAGGQLEIGFNSIDNQLLPGKGVSWLANFTSLTALNEASLPLTRLVSNFQLYAPLSSNKRFTYVLRAGGGHIFSEHFEYFQALTLGANNYLRGYRKSRFAGSSMAYVSNELRVKLFTLQSRILPGDFGLLGFNDLGRVWMNGEVSNKWHSAYGGGFYFTPFNMVLLSAALAVSEEEPLFNISLGTRLNIVF